MGSLRRQHSKLKYMLVAMQSPSDTANDIIGTIVGV